MAAMDPSDFRRFSVRNTKRPDYSVSGSMASHDIVEQPMHDKEDLALHGGVARAVIAGMESRKEAGGRAGASRPKVAVKKESQQVSKGRSTARVSKTKDLPPSKTPASRAGVLNSRVSKRTHTPSKTTTAQRKAPTRQRKNFTNATATTKLPSPTETASPGDSSALGLDLDSQGESSTLNEHADAEFTDFAPAPVVAPPIAPVDDQPQAHAAMQDDQASPSETATLMGDTVTLETGVGEPETPAAQTQDSPSTTSDEIVVATHTNENVTSNTAPGSDTSSSFQPAGNVDQSRNNLRPRRDVPAIQRFAPGADPASIDALEALPAFDPVPERADADTEESPRKKRKTSAPTAKTAHPVPKTPRAAKSTASRQTQKRSGESTKQTRKRSTIAKLPIAVIEESSTESVRITTAANKVTPVKSAMKRATKATPKTPAPPFLPPTPESIAAVPAPAPIAVDAGKLALSGKMTARAPLGSKPLPQGQPLVWADSRQALCETLPYFKRPQGGCYQNDSHVYGFLFDSVGHCREYLDEDIIICRAGGSMEQDPNGGMVQKKDQSMKEAQVQAIINDIAHQNPLIVICGNRNGGAKCEMPHQYSVLGWYKPVCLWEEKTAGKGRKIWTTIKYRLERLNQSGEPIPWHAPVGSDIATFRGLCDAVYQQYCGGCGKSFCQVYLQGWMCLNSACHQFWRFSNGFSAPAGNVGFDYNPDFLLSRAPAWGDEALPPAPVRPPIPDVGNILGDDLAYINTRGICCPKCGRCNSRRLFDRWVCENPSCDYELRPQHRPVMPKHLHTPWDVAPTLVRNKVEAGVHLNVEHKFGYKVCTYTFDGIDGCFIHAAATKAILGAPGGPDDMMADLQSQDLGLERRVFAVTKMFGGKKPGLAGPADVAPGAPPSPPAEDQAAGPSVEGAEEAPKDKRIFEDGDLMTAFSMNYGMPYKFVASGASRSFNDSPKAVNDCRYRLNWAARALLGKSKETLDFNEELIFTYLEGQKIEYHDDGEDGLGPEIASLSLGGRAKMHMRMKAKHFVGCSKTGILTEEKPVPGSIDGPAMYQKRLAAWEELQALKRTDSVAYSRRRKELPKELGIFDKRAKKADDMVTITLSHGDLMVMDGYDIQRYLEHKVVPEGYLRFALTCRTVLEDHLKPQEKPDYVVEPDGGKYDGSVGY